MQGPVHIVATGVRTPLGLRSAPSAAAVRAGLSRLGEHPSLIDRLGEPMVAVLDSEIDPDVSGVDRFVALAESALRELFEHMSRLPPGSRVPVSLALPEVRPGFTDRDAAMIGDRLGRWTGLPCELDPIRIHPLGHAAGVPALEAAIAALTHGHEFCVVGGIESYFHTDTMTWLDGNRQLAGSDGRSSFVPGEGAGFLLLSRRARRDLGMNALASIVACATATERARIKTADLCLGEGLTAAVELAVAGLGPGERVSDIFCDINGERYRGQEWGFVCLRLARHFDDPTGYRAPADLWGDMGAASIPLFAMLACQAAARGYAKGTSSLLWAGSEAGLRGALLLRMPGAARGEHD